MLSKMSKIMCGFGLDCAKLSGYSGRKAWQLSTIQTKSAHGLVAFCSTNFEWRRHESPKLFKACPKHKKIISMNSCLMWLFSNTNFIRANWKKNPWDKLEDKLFSRDSSKNLNIKKSLHLLTGYPKKCSSLESPLKINVIVFVFGMEQAEQQQPYSSWSCSQLSN